MMRPALFALLLSLPAAATECQVKGLWEVRLEGGMGCERFRELFREATGELVRLGLEPPKLRTVTVVVLDVEHFDCDGLVALGCYAPRTQTVRLGRLGVGLLHEFLHHYVRRLSVDHRGWAENGWMAAANRFDARVYQREDQATNAATSFATAPRPIQ